MISLDWNPSARTLRQFAAIAFVVLAGMAAVGALRGGSGPGEVVLVTLAVAVAGLGWLRPLALRLVFVGFSLAVFPIGFVLSHVILLVIFYGVITPLGALGRLAGPDFLKLGRGPASQSYWQERRRPRDKASYLRQA